MGQGNRVHRALDEGQQGQLGRQASTLDFLDDVIQVARAAGEHSLQVFGPLQIEVLLLVDELRGQVRESEAVANPLPQVAGGRGVLLRRLELEGGGLGLLDVTSLGRLAPGQGHALAGPGRGGRAWRGRLSGAGLNRFAGAAGR